MLAMNKNEENRSAYYLWGGGVTLPASCGLAVCPGCEETKKDMLEGDGSMKFIISGKNITVTEGLKTAVQDKNIRLNTHWNL